MPHLRPLLPLLLIAAAAAGESPAAGLAAFAGGNVRMTWLHGHWQFDQNDAQRFDNEVRYIDAQRGAVETLVPAGRHFRSFITSDGEGVLFSTYGRDVLGLAYAEVPALILIDLRTRRARHVGTGVGLGVVRHPRSGKPLALTAKQIDKRWVFSLVDLTAPEQAIADIIPRAGSFTTGTGISGDLAYVAWNPWPNTLFTPTKDVGKGLPTMKGTNGCFPQIAPDASRRRFNFTGKHQDLHFFDGEPGARHRVITVAQVPHPAAPAEMEHPTWTNRLRLLTLTGPYPKGVRNDNSAPAVEVWLGRFDSAHTRIEAWHRLTIDETAQAWPHAWIAGDDPDARW